MKKTKFFTLALLSAAVIFTSSCSDDEDAPLSPSLTVTETNTGKTGGAVEIEQGQPLEFAWETRKGDNNIKTFSLSMSGVYSTNNYETYQGKTLPYSVSGGDKSIYRDTISFPSAGLNLGSTNYTFTSTDGTNPKSVSFNVTVVASVTNTPLSDAQNFEWKRVAGSDGTGLAQFGLKWTNNTSTNAIVAISGNTTMYKLPSASWTTLVTKEDLAVAMSAASSISKYEEVSVTAPTKSYDDVLAVSHDGTNYLIHVTNSVVETGGSGTTVTIGGKYKK